jgi:hypothetical protein
VQPHNEIAAILDGAGAVSAARVEQWLTSDDEETLAGALALVRSHSARIEGALNEAVLPAAARRYYTRALTENRAGRFVEDRRTAGHSLAEWYFQLLEREPLPHAILDALKDTLAAVYRAGDDALRAAVITNCLDRLFESRRVAVLFSDWADDPALEPAYRAATDWGEGFWTGHRSGAGGS